MSTVKNPKPVLGDILDRLLARSADESPSFANLVKAAALDPSRDFVGAALRDMDFRGEDLRGFDFSFADLSGSDFRRANVSGVPFRGAKLSGVIGLRPRMPTVIMEVGLDDPDPIIEKFRDAMVEVFDAIGTHEIMFCGSDWPVLRGRSAILAVHDLDVVPSADLEKIRKTLELKMSAAEGAADEAGVDTNKLFYAMLLVKHVRALPFARYPSGRFHRWHLLSFEGTPTGLRPISASLAVFRNQLSHWTKSLDSLAD